MGDALQNTSLPENLAGILDITYNPTSSSPLPFTPFPKRPRPSQLKERLAPLFDAQGAGDLTPAVVRAVSATWDAYTEGSVAPTDFFRAPIGPAKRPGILGPAEAIHAMLLLHNKNPDKLLSKEEEEEEEEEEERLPHVVLQRTWRVLYEPVGEQRPTDRDMTVAFFQATAPTVIVTVA
ncbi:hypothetical protein DFH07DRAFT_775095 [Mycena maculata]|uniref:Uncharacterized protein n=1 Tax=Mycena maculata TaxID=230809 RepID=A0AAD7IVU3_9AGAR|nr:hypothetical protein DFH07DRAFT_775095 [Mycena maculata]